MRCFVGLPLPDELRSAAERVRRLICETDASWAAEKWVPVENLHITVRFLGDVAPELVDPVTAAIAGAVGSTASFELRCTGVRARPSTGRSTMLWLSFDDPTTECGLLVDRIGGQLEPLGYPRGQRAFMAHATLVRTRKPRCAASVVEAANTLPELRKLTVSDPPVTLYESRLTPRGPIYSGLSTWSLRGD